MRLHGGPGGGIDACPAAHRAFQRRLFAEHPAQQHRQRIFVPSRPLDIGDDLLGGDLAPVFQDGGVERADIGEMPVETAARDAHGLRQRLGLQRGEAALGQRLQALIEPVLAES